MRKVAILTSLLIIGCAMGTPETNQTTQGLKDGLTIFYASVEEGVSGVYQEDGTRVYFEVLRGEEMTTWLEDPSSPRWEMDLRFLDTQGLHFYSAIGGHVIDPTWNEDLRYAGEVEASSFSPRDRIMRQDSRLLLVKLAKAIADEEFAPELNAEKRRILTCAADIGKEAVNNQKTFTPYHRDDATIASQNTTSNKAPAAIANNEVGLPLQMKLV